MQRVNDRKITLLSLDLHDLLELLRVQGFLPAELCGSDVRVIQVRNPGFPHQIQIWIEGESLPEMTRYHGYCPSHNIELPNQWRKTPKVEEP
jgi:hypothetical protein